MYVCLYSHHIHIARVRINRVRLPILLVVSRKGKINTHVSLSSFALENFVSRDGFGSPVPRQHSSKVLTCHHELEFLHPFIT